MMQALPLTIKLLGYGMLVFAAVRYPAEFWWVGLLGIGLIWYSRLMSRGKLGFWQLCAREPELAYRFLKDSSAWHVFEGELPANYRELVPSGEWTGSFRLMVPGIGPIWIFGKDGEYEETQNEFVEAYSRVQSATIGDQAITGAAASGGAIPRPGDEVPTTSEPSAGLRSLS